MDLTHNINKFFICLIPVCLISGPFLPDLVATYLGIFFIAFCIYKKKYENLKNFYFLFFILLYIYININSFFSFNPNISFQSSVPYLRVVLFIFCISFYVKEDFSFLRFLYFFTYFSLFCLLADSVFQSQTGYNIFQHKIDNSLRVSSFFGDELIMGSYVSRILPVLIGVSYVVKLNFRNYLNIGLLFLATILVILSSERLSLFYLGASLISYFILEFNKKNLFFLFLIILTIFLVFKVNKASYERIFIQTKNQLVQAGRIIGFSPRHLMHYSTAYEMYLEKKLLGHGLKSFRYLCGKDKYIQEIIKKKREYYVVAKEDGYFNFKKESGNQQQRSINIMYKNQTSEIFGITYNLFLYDKNKNLFHEHEINFTKVNKENNYTENSKYNFAKGDILFVNYDVGGRCNTHPHNIYMQFLSEIGILGFLFFITIFGYVVFNLLRIFLRLINKSFLEKVEKSELFILLSIFLAMFPLVPSGNYFNNWILVMSYLPIGIYLGLFKKT